MSLRTVDARTFRVYMLRPDLKPLTRFKADRPNLKPVDPLPSGFKTGQLILSHTWLFRNSACERFVGSFWPLAMKWKCTLERRKMASFFPRFSPPLIGEHVASFTKPLETRLKRPYKRR